MLRTMTISDARRQLTSLDLNREETVAVTRSGKRVYALMAWDVYESLSETLEILSDPDLVEQLQKSMREADQGRLVSHEEVLRHLG